MVETNVQKPAGAEGMHYALPNFGALPGFAEAALAFKHTGTQTDIPEPVLQLIAAQEPKISQKDVESLINEVVGKSGLSRSNPQLAEFIAEAMSNIGAPRSTLSGLRDVGLRVAEAAARTSGDDGVDDRAAMIARHRDRYLNNAEYRAAIDSMMDEHAKDMKPVFEALAERDKTAQAHGVTTSVDDEVAQLEKELEETRKKGNLYAPEILEKERELLEKRRRQSEEREAEYIRMGRPDLAEKERETRASTIEPALEKVEETQKKADLLDVSEYKNQNNVNPFDVQSPEQNLTGRTEESEKAQDAMAATVIVANEPTLAAPVMGSLAALGNDAPVQPVTTETQLPVQMATVNLEQLPLGEMRLAVAEASEIQTQPVKTTIAPGALSILA